MTLKSETLRHRVEFDLADSLDERIHDPLKQWKLSPMDVESRTRWEQYTKAKARARNPDYHRGPIPKEMYVPSVY